MKKTGRVCSLYWLTFSSPVGWVVNGFIKMYCRAVRFMEQSQVKDYCVINRRETKRYKKGDLLTICFVRFCHIYHHLGEPPPCWIEARQGASRESLSHEQLHSGARNDTASLGWHMDIIHAELTDDTSSTLIYCRSSRRWRSFSSVFKKLEVDSGSFLSYSNNL